MKSSGFSYDAKGVRIRQMQYLIGSGSAVAGPSFVIIVVSFALSIATNYIVGTTFNIIPAVIGLLVAQSACVGLFLKTEKYDEILARAIVMLYFTFYAFIVLAVDPDYTLMFTALLGFPSFTVILLGSREGTIWSLLTLGVIGGGAFVQGSANDFADIELSHIIFVAAQTLIIIMFAYVIDNVAVKYAQQLISKQQQSQASQARYEVLLDSVTDGLIAVDEKGIIQFVNKAAEQLTGRSSSELLHKFAPDTIILSDDKKDEAIITGEDYPLTKVLATDENISIDQLSPEEICMVRKDKSKFEVGIIASPVKVGEDSIGALMLFKDLTVLNATEKAKSEFVSLASHQLRTPLNVVSWYIEKLIKQKKGDLNEKQLDYMQEIQQNNQRMIDLVADLLNVSRVDIGKIKVKHEEVKLLELVDPLIREIEPMAISKNINFTQELLKQEYVFEDSDKNLITIMVQNLLSNAMKYTPEEGEVNLRIVKVKKGVDLSLQHEIKASKDGIMIQVTDSGIGIPEHQKEKIFGKLFRADNVTTMDVEGTGLGLYVTRSFARELGGEIWFNSTVDHGATFFIYLPER